MALRLRLRKPEDHIQMPKPPPSVTIARVEMFDPEGNRIYVYHDHRTLYAGDTYMLQMTFDDDSAAS